MRFSCFTCTDFDEIESGLLGGFGMEGDDTVGGQYFFDET
jgi:hypothetical protein